jgi:hypothetical protein
MIGRPIVVIDFDVDGVPDSEVVDITPAAEGKASARVMTYRIERPTLNLAAVEAAAEAKAG